MEGPTLSQRHSKALFGQTHRLALMIAIARSESGSVNPTDLSFDLRLNQSAFQVALRDLVDAGLILRTTDGRRTLYERQPSKVWEWVLEVEARVSAKENPERAVRQLRPTPDR